MTSVIHLKQDLINDLISHACRDYPNECCGILIGQQVDDGARVDRAVPGINISERDKTRSYQLDWRTLFSTVRLVRRTAEHIVGFYHSHPDGSAGPSDSDVKNAWIRHSYVIVSLSEGQFSGLASWRMTRGGLPFARERIAAV